ncbi:hypothetical protein B1H18_07555 [Streptomyces tsukubensis]|uniref:Uncharacterized protein n=1 Tax=Streptomyces tsukubensis TaxID=83656 RepID=A0A1V4ACM8_9ACTN|nr:hypothetical protein B1H18_07555 [Streptomyces tsukubensis]
MSLKFGGQGYQFQCPLCDYSISGRRGAQVEARIREAKGRHDTRCPAWVIDPLRLQNMTQQQTLTVLGRPS